MSNNEKRPLEDVVSELNEKAEEFALVAKEDVKDSDEKTRLSAEKIADDTIEAIKTLIDQVALKYEEITESEKFIEFSEAIKKLTNNLITEGKNKIVELKNNPEIKEGWEKTKEQAVNAGSKVVGSIKENEELMETLNIVKGVTINIAKKSASVIKNVFDDITENPKVKEGISKAKAATLDVAGKAYDKLEDWLSPEEATVETEETTDSTEK